MNGIMIWVIIILEIVLYYSRIVIPVIFLVGLYGMFGILIYKLVKK